MGKQYKIRTNTELLMTIARNFKDLKIDKCKNKKHLLNNTNKALAELQYRTELLAKNRNYSKEHLLRFYKEKDLLK